MKDELGGTILIEFVALRPKTYSYLTDGNNNVKSEAYCVYTEEINKIALNSNDHRRL